MEGRNVLCLQPPQAACPAPVRAMGCSGTTVPYCRAELSSQLVRYISPTHNCRVRDPDPRAHQR